jgi:penicillin-binding protein 2
MQKFYRPSRIITIFVLMALLVTIYMTTLYKLQIYGAAADESAMLPQNVIKRTELLTANRGDILDRNGVLLVSTRPSYNITLSRDTLLKCGNTNENILKLVYAAVEDGINYTDEFPITIGAPFSYLSDMTPTQKDRLQFFLEEYDQPADISASDLIVWMKDHYGIDYTTSISDARLIIGIRYELEIRAIKQNITPYIFASDVDVDFLAVVKEQGFAGVNIETTTKRQYHTEYAAHLLGYLGKMTQEEYAVYKDLDYSMDALVGKAGAEAAFEEYLHGKDGTQVISTDENGTVLNIEPGDTPEPGKNVFLSIDIGLQAAAEESLESKINFINTARAEEDRVTGGAVVVTDVKTGEVLAICSYPTYDPATISREISNLLNDNTKPMINRATTGIYNPGSTFKMVTALAGLRFGAITRWTTVYDEGIYDKYAPSYSPKCWIYEGTGQTHGLEDVVGALKDSCNYFFYWLSDKIDSDPIEETAADFGFGSKTGIELPEKAGILGTKEYKKETLDESWYKGDTFRTAIGQGYNQFTPVQLVNYVATIANGGTRYSLTTLNNIRSADYSSVIYEPEQKVLGTIEEKDFIAILQEGMKAVAATGGTAASVFANYPVSVAAKTGTVQSNTSSINHAVFVCYAPADDPEIAISIVVEKGKSGSTIMEIAKDIMDYYFSDDVDVKVASDNALLP